MEFREALRRGSNELDLTLEPREEALFDTYYALLIEEEKTAGLTGIKEPVDVAVKHFLDALAIRRWVAFKPGERLIDVGSGAGFPGIPLSVTAPGLQVILLEAVRKKVDFLRKAIALLGLRNAEAVWGRAEEYGRLEGYREAFDWAVARAVAPLRELLEYALPFLRRGGVFLAYKGPKGLKEVEASHRAADVLGGKVEQVQEYRLPLTGDERLLIFIRKTGLTPLAYPRRAGMPRKKPL